MGWGWATSLLLTSVQVTGDTTCPTPAQVAAQLASYGQTPEDVNGAQLASAKLVRTDPQLRIDLFNAAGELLGERRIPSSENCGELARAAAVVLATWEPAPPPPAPPSAPRIPQLSEKSPFAPELITWPSRWRVGAALGLSWTGDVAPTLTLTGAARLGESPWRIELQLEAEGQRTLTVGAGTAAWRRWLFAAGASYQLFNGTVTLQVDAAVLLALLEADGNNYTPDFSAVDSDWGITGGVDLHFGSGAFQPVLHTGLSVWPEGHDLLVGHTNLKRPLPQLEWISTVGVDFNWL